MSRVIGTDRWNIRVEENEGNGEGVVHITYRAGNKILAVPLFAAQELAGILPVILQVREYEPPAS